MQGNDHNNLHIEQLIHYKINKLTRFKVAHRVYKMPSQVQLSSLV